uniref:DUF1981 domain-containing protein n=1 Tax=Anisakis simplex TaxID=6269 RepID=A0A0M3J1Q9_ANISI
LAAIQRTVQLCLIGAAFRLIQTNRRKFRLLSKCLAIFLEWRASDVHLIRKGAEEAAELMVEGMCEKSLSLLVYKYSGCILSLMYRSDVEWEVMRSARVVCSMLEWCGERAFFETASVMNTQMMTLLDRQAEYGHTNVMKWYGHCQSFGTVPSAGCDNGNGNVSDGDEIAVVADSLPRFWHGAICRNCRAVVLRAIMNFVSCSARWFADEREEGDESYQTDNLSDKDSYQSTDKGSDKNDKDADNEAEVWNGNKKRRSRPEFVLAIEQILKRSLSVAWHGDGHFAKVLALCHLQGIITTMEMSVAVTTVP